MRRAPHTKQSVRTEYSAGGIVFRRTPHGPEIAFLLDPFHKWTFAKGHIEPRERPMHAAVREVKEEMGISRLRVVAPLGRIDWWFRERRGSAHSPRGARVHKFVHYFLMEVPLQTRLTAQRSELIYDVRWVPARAALKFSSYKDVRPVLRKALDFLRRM